MKIFICMLIGLFLCRADANSSWIEQNELVGKIGGWRVYSQESIVPNHAPNTSIFTLEQAIQRVLKYQFDSIHYLPGSEFSTDFYLLSSAQQMALKQRSSLIFETTKSYYELVALKEKQVHMQNVLEVVESAAELSSRMYKVGNLNLISLLKQNKDLYNKKLEYKQLQVRYEEAKERFIQRMNFQNWHSNMDVEARLPELPNAPRKLNSRELKAIDFGYVDYPSSVQVRSNARISFYSYLNSYQRVKLYKEQILPNQKQISEENILRYNAMLIDVFHLLEDAENQSKTVIQYIDANAAFLIEAAQLEKELIHAQLDFSNINLR